MTVRAPWCPEHRGSLCDTQICTEPSRLHTHAPPQLLGPISGEAADRTPCTCFLCTCPLPLLPTAGSPLLFLFLPSPSLPAQLPSYQPPGPYSPLCPHLPQNLLRGQSTETRLPGFTPALS